MEGPFECLRRTGPDEYTSVFRFWFSAPGCDFESSPAGLGVVIGVWRGGTVRWQTVFSSEPCKPGSGSGRDFTFPFPADALLAGSTAFDPSVALVCVHCPGTLGPDFPSGSDSDRVLTLPCEAALCFRPPSGALGKGGPGPGPPVPFAVTRNLYGGTGSSAGAGTGTGTGTGSSAKTDDGWLRGLSISGLFSAAFSAATSTSGAVHTLPDSRIALPGGRDTFRMTDFSQVWNIVGAMDVLTCVGSPAAPPLPPWYVALWANAAADRDTGFKEESVEAAAPGSGSGSGSDSAVPTCTDTCTGTGTGTGGEFFDHTNYSPNVERGKKFDETLSRVLAVSCATTAALRIPDVANSPSLVTGRAVWTPDLADVNTWIWPGHQVLCAGGPTEQSDVSRDCSLVGDCEDLAWFAAGLIRSSAIRAETNVPRLLSGDIEWVGVGACVVEKRGILVRDDDPRGRGRRLSPSSNGMLSRLFSHSGPDRDPDRDPDREPDPTIAEGLSDGEIRTAHMIVCVKFRGSPRVILGDATSRSRGWKWAGRVYFIVLDYVSASSGVGGCRGDTIYLYDSSRPSSDSASGQDIENPGYIIVPDPADREPDPDPTPGPGALFLSKSMKPSEFQRLVNAAARPFGGVPGQV